MCLKSDEASSFLNNFLSKAEGGRIHSLLLFENNRGLLLPNWGKEVELADHNVHNCTRSLKISVESCKQGGSCFTAYGNFHVSVRGREETSKYKTAILAVLVDSFDDSPD